MRKWVEAFCAEHFFVPCLRIGMACGAVIAFAFVLVVVAFLPTDVGPSVVGCAKAHNEFEYLSSFMEVMIALNAVSSLHAVREKLGALNAVGEMIGNMMLRCVFKHEAVAVDEGLVREAYKKGLNSGIRAIGKSLATVDRLVCILGLATAFVLTALLLFGVPDSDKPYIAFSAAPFLMYVFALCIYHLALHLRASAACWIEVGSRCMCEAGRGDEDKDIVTSSLERL